MMSSEIQINEKNKNLSIRQTQVKNLTTPSWQNIFFTMSIDVKSTFDTGTDYSVMLTKTPYSFFKDVWSKQVREISNSNKIRILNENSIKVPYDKNSPYAIPFSIDLADLNYPERYYLIFTLTNEFVLNHRLCAMVDTTNWFIIPPPHYKIIPLPDTIQLSPGESKDVFFKIIGSNNTDLSSTATFDLEPIPKLSSCK